MGYIKSSIEEINPKNCARENKTRKKNFLLLIKLIQKNKVISLVFRLIITILFVILVNRSIDLFQIKSLAQKVCIWPLILAVVLGIYGQYFQMLRWKEILRSQGFPSTIPVALKTLLWGHLLAFITPGRVGELMRAWGLNDKKKMCSVFAVLMDRFYSVISILTFGIIAIIIHLTFFNTVNIGKLKIFAIIALLTLLISILILKYHAYFYNCFKKGIAGLVSKYTEGLRLVNSKKVFFYTTAAYVSLILQTAIILGMFGSSSFRINIIIASESYLFMLFFPFFIANIGIREYTFMLFLSEFKTFFNELNTSSTAFGVSTVILLINIILPALAGMVWGIFERFNGSKTN